MDVSVCIVSWNTKDLLYKCIKSIKEKTLGLVYEIIVVDNASADGSGEMVLENFPDCKLIESKKNLGFAKGNNMAVKEASGKYILYLNPDTEVVTNAIGGIFSFLENNANYGAAGCKLTDPIGNIQYTCAAAFPTPLNTLSSLLLLDKAFPQSKLLSSRELNYWNHEDSRGVECLSGACMMVRKDVVESLGGFDEKIFMYSEDLDLCYRILSTGRYIYYLSTEVIIHNEGASTKVKSNKNFSSLMQKASNYYFFRKHFGIKKAEQFRLAVCLGSFSRLILIFVSFPLFVLVKEINPVDAFIKYINIFLWSIGLRTTNHLVEG